MTVIDAARQLGAVVQTDPRYIEYVKAKTMNDADEAISTLFARISLWKPTRSPKRQTARKSRS